MGMVVLSLIYEGGPVEPVELPFPPKNSWSEQSKILSHLSHMDRMDGQKTKVEQQQPSSFFILQATFILVLTSMVHAHNMSAATSSRARVFSAYRRIFRARKDLFDGDVQAMKESRVAIKSEFAKNRQAVTSGDHFEGLLSMVDEAVDMLRYGIVRGNLNQKTGNYGALQMLDGSNILPKNCGSFLPPFTSFSFFSTRQRSKLNRNIPKVRITPMWSPLHQRRSPNYRNPWWRRAAVVAARRNHRSAG